MISRVLKLFAYAKSPVKAFAAFHPLRFFKYAAFLWLGKKIWNLVTGRSGSPPPEEAGSGHGSGDGEEPA